MHELSIALGIVQIAEENCSKADASRVDAIELQIGQLAGIERSALEFAWPEAIKGSKLQHAERSIEWVNGKAKCLDCECVYSVDTLYEACPECDSYAKKIISGKELKVKTLVVS